VSDPESLAEKAEKIEFEGRKERIDLAEDGDVALLRTDATPALIRDALQLSRRDVEELRHKSFEHFERLSKVARMLKDRPLASALTLAQKWALEVVRKNGLDKSEPRRIDEDWADVAGLELGLWLDCDGVLTRHYENDKSLNAVRNFHAPAPFQTAPFDIAIREEIGVTKDANEHLFAGQNIFKNDLQDPSAYSRAPDFDKLRYHTSRINSEVRAAIDLRDPWGYMLAREKSLLQQAKDMDHAIPDPQIFYYLQGFRICGVRRFDFVTGGDALFYHKLLKKYQLILDAIFGGVEFRVFDRHQPSTRGSGSRPGSEEVRSRHALGEEGGRLQKSGKRGRDHHFRPASFSSLLARGFGEARERSHPHLQVAGEN